MTSLGDSYGRGFDRGSGFGCGYGDSYGHGVDYGYGEGAGYGCGYGEGYASGEGYGSSPDYGDGYGYGSGDGVPVATLGEYEVRAVVTPWGRAARVGCQVHSLDTWRDRWREIAREHDVEVSAEEVTRLIALIEAVPFGPEWLPSEEGGDHD